MVARKVLASATIVVLLVAAAFILISLQPGRGSPSKGTQSTNSATTAMQGSGILKGVTFSPASYDSAGIGRFVADFPMAGNALEWAGDWEQLGGGAPAQVAQLASQHGLSLVVVVQFFDQTSGQLLRPLNSTNEQNYLTMAENFAKMYRPAFFGVGIEVNILYEKNTSSFGSFVSFFPQVRDAVKAASSSTTVFTIFQLERMNGLDGGLYGGTNDPSKAEWQLLALFPQADILGFTSYPGLIYHSPTDIPSDYYSGIAAHTNKSIGFTELGWQSGYVAGGWGSDETAQASFVSTFFRLSSGLNRSFVVWSFLYDQSAAAPFNTMGLWYVNGTPKQAWQTWVGA